MRKEVRKQKVLRFMADFETLTGKDVVNESLVDQFTEAQASKRGL